MYFKSLKINIILNIGILLIAGMLITGFVITSFSKNEIIKTEFSKTDIILFHIENTISKFDNNFKQDDNIQKYLSKIVEQPNVYLIHFFNNTEHSVYENPMISNNPKASINQQQIKRYTFQAIDKKERISHYFGKTFGIFWQDNKYLSISYPVEQNMGITFIIALDNVYSSYREKQKVFLFYILFNTVFLCFIGLLRFSKIIIKPIKKLSTIVKDYNGEKDALYMLHPAENEFGMLSNSLTSMISRISEDKQKLEHNIDELKKAQTEMIRAEKMSSIGKLSAGVAHEIGNPIGIILGYLELLKQKNISDLDRNDFVNRSEIEIQRIDKIIKQLLNLSRKSKTEYLPNSTHEIITDTINILKIQPSFSKIDLKLELDAENEIVLSDSDQLKQVFLNLILNAVDAILLKKPESKKGVVQIRTVEIEEKYNSFLEIRISDNGIGVSKEDANKIFDPFFTTKEPGSGTGLGLWVSYMIIDEIHGSIRVESKEGEGTDFILLLPLKKMRK